MPKWLWIFWIPQVLQFLALPRSDKNDVLLSMCKVICHYLCVSYPQVTWYPLKAILEFHKDMQSPNRIFD